MDRRPPVAVYAEGDRHGVHHLVRRHSLLTEHAHVSVADLVVRTGIEPRGVRPELRCDECWAVFVEDVRPTTTTRDRLVELGRQQPPKRRWPGRSR